MFWSDPIKYFIMSHNEIVFYAIKPSQSLKTCLQQQLLGLYYLESAGILKLFFMS